MIWINFGKWNDAGRKYFMYSRIYLKGYIWTPFVRVSKRVYKPDNSAPAPAIDEELIDSESENITQELYECCLEAKGAYQALKTLGAGHVLLGLDNSAKRLDRAINRAKNKQGCWGNP